MKTSQENAWEMFGTIIGWALVILFVVWLFHGSSNSDNTTSAAPAPTTNYSTSTNTDTATYSVQPTEPSDSEIQGYWYCWDSGATDPHHLGYHVSGDHLCTYGELRAANMSGY